MKRKGGGAKAPRTRVGVKTVPAVRGPPRKKRKIMPNNVDAAKRTRNGVASESNSGSDSDSSSDRDSDSDSDSDSESAAERSSNEEEEEKATEEKKDPLSILIDLAPATK